MFRGTTSKELTEYEKKLQEYYWKCFISEFSKIIFFFLFFTLLGFTKEYFVALLSLMLLRNNGGGLHCKHYISCLLVSFLFLFGSILLAIYITPPRSIICISTLICILPGYYLVPITSCNRPAATPLQIKKSKFRTLILLSLFFILVCICPANRYLYIGFWTVILHIAQLTLAHFIKEVKYNA